jgi:hypothetical protein
MSRHIVPDIPMQAFPMSRHSVPEVPKGVLDVPT